MATSLLSPPKSASRRHFLKTTILGSAGLALYSSEIARHWIDVVPLDIHLTGLPAAFDGMRIAQISDIHLDEYTEPFFLRAVIDRINRLKPDAVFFTGDFVTDGLGTQQYAISAAWQCAELLRALECRALYAALGNHDVSIGRKQVTAALVANGITVLDNASLPLVRNNARIWLAGLDDPVNGVPQLDHAIPDSIRNLPDEPIILLCHAPDYADHLLAHPAGDSVALMLSGHTHGGQIRLPLVGALSLPPMGRKYVEGFFRLGGMQLYVNRGIGAVGVPFRLNCAPEITLHTLRRA